jgi:hypothetical protein
MATAFIYEMHYWVFVPAGYEESEVNLQPANPIRIIPKLSKRTTDPEETPMTLSHP